MEGGVEETKPSKKGNEVKYVLFEDPSGIRFPIVIPNHIDHSLFVRALEQTHPGIKPVSAGFMSIAFLDDENKVSAWGSSVTLKLSPQPDDNIWLQKLVSDT